MVATQGGTLKSMIDNTQNAVGNEMQKAKSVIDCEISRVNNITASANAFATTQAATFEMLRQDWTETKKSVRAEHSKLIADDKADFRKVSAKYFNIRTNIDS